MSRLPNTLGAPALAMDTGQTIVRQVADRPNIWEVQQVETHFYDVGIRSVYAPGRVIGLQVRAGPDGIDTEEADFIESSYGEIQSVHFFGGPIKRELLELMPLNDGTLEITSDAPFNLSCVKFLLGLIMPIRAIADLNKLEVWYRNLSKDERDDADRRLSLANVNSIAIVSNVPATHTVLFQLPKLESVRLGHGFTHRRELQDLNTSRIHDLELLGSLAALNVKCIKLHFNLNDWVVESLTRFTSLTELHIELADGFYVEQAAGAIKSLATLRTLGLYFDDNLQTDHDTIECLSFLSLSNITTLTVGAEPDSAFFLARTQFISVQDVTLLLWNFTNESEPFDFGFFVDCCPNVRKIKVVDWAEDSEQIANLTNVDALNQLQFLSSITFNIHSTAQVEQTGDLNAPVEFNAVDNFQQDHPLLHCN